LKTHNLNIKLDFSKSDLEQIKSINDSHGYDPDPTHYCTSAIVVDNEGKVIGFGGVKPIFESVIILDNNASSVSKTLTVQKLISTGIMKSEQLGIQDWHAFVSEPNFIKMLKKSFGYKDCEGTSLYLRL
jgi:hypothetical protein